MTIFGPDIANYQAGLALDRLANASFVIAKTTEGTYYTDQSYQLWRRSAGTKRFLWYHFLSGENLPAQVAHTKANVGDLSLAGMLDVEPAGQYSPTLAQTLGYIDEAHHQGLNLRLCYLPRWVWQAMGSPSLTGLRDRGVSLVASSYPGGAGTALQIYPGDGAAGWASYGDVTPLLYQFTSQALDAGQRIDYNAFKGTIEQFDAAIHVGNTPTGGPDMTYTVSAGWQNDYPDAAAELQRYAPVGTQMDAEQAAAYGAMRAIVTAFRTGQIESKLDSVINTLANPAALAAAISAHLSGGGAPDEATLTAFIAAHLKIGLTAQ